MRRKSHSNHRKALWKQSLQNKGAISKADGYLSLTGTMRLCCFHPNPLFYSCCLFISGTASPVQRLCPVPRCALCVQLLRAQGQHQAQVVSGAGLIMDSGGHFSISFPPTFLNISPRKVVSGAMWYCHNFSSSVEAANSQARCCVPSWQELVQLC